MTIILTMIALYMLGMLYIGYRAQRSVKTPPTSSSAAAASAPS